MLWIGRPQSSNVDDRRGMGMGGKTEIGGEIGSIVVIVLFALLGGNPEDLMNATPINTNIPMNVSTQEEELAE